MAAKRFCLTWALIAIFLLSNVESREFRLQSRILGGVTATKGQFPYMASLINRQNQFPFCGGAIINSFFVLSSGYCAESYEVYPELLTIYLGAWSLREMFMSDVAEVKLHPQFNLTTKVNDISLIRTKEKIIFTNLVTPIPLPMTNVPNEKGAEFVVSGFGLWFRPERIHDTTAYAQTLLYEETTSLTMESCINKYSDVSRKQYPEADYIRENVMCTSNGFGRGLCLGDRGNPLVKDDTLYGIASWCVECSSNYPNLYTKVYPYLDWIQNFTST